MGAGRRGASVTGHAATDAAGHAATDAAGHASADIAGHAVAGITGHATAGFAGRHGAEPAAEAVEVVLLRPGSGGRCGSHRGYQCQCCFDPGVSGGTLCRIVIGSYAAAGDRAPASDWQQRCGRCGREPRARQAPPRCWDWRRRRRR